MSRVFLDTNIFIYLIEDTGERGRMASDLIERLALRRDLVLTSTLTLGEVLTLPVSLGNTELARQYEEHLTSQGMRLLDFDRAAAKEYARLRNDKSIKPPDAIQLATAAAAQCDLFITNDDRLSRKLVNGIHFITALSRVPI